MEIVDLSEDWGTKDLVEYGAQTFCHMKSFSYI